MAKDIDSRVKEAAIKLGVDKPIMSHKVVGDRIELHLYGGSVVTWPPPGKRLHPGLIDQLEDRPVSELRKLAREYHIAGQSKMNRAQLIAALEEIF
jgi:hypothetical protein